ncbi:MAG: glycosyltransferase family 4 protein, partial [Anaerolinea sp.]|nr:glycosyltransferase family 4 protein [Anaerolinea sp.]
LKVLFLAENSSLRNWRVEKERIRFNYEVLPGRVVAKTYQDASLFFNPTIAGRIQRGKFDWVIFGGYYHPSYWLALAYCKAARKRVMLWNESNLRDYRIQCIFRKKAKEIMIHAFDRYLVAGTAQLVYLESFGIDRAKIWHAPNAVDVEHFANGSTLHRAHKEAIKADLGITTDVILFVGRLIDEKGVGDLLLALEAVARHHAVTLVIVGSGPDEDRYKTFVRDRNLPVIFTGFQQQDILPKFYAIGDIFAFPSRTDQWGLVLNEALACGLPVVASSAAGAVDDLVADGENGFIHSPGDWRAMAEAFTKLLSAPDLRVRMSMRSKQIITDYTPEKCAEGFYRAIMGITDQGETG